MKELLLISSFFLVMLAVGMTGPMVALATMHEVTTTPTQRCGLKCVIVSKVFDNASEAEAYARKHDTLVYELSSSPGNYFVDTQMSEASANLIEGAQ